MNKDESSIHTERSLVTYTIWQTRGVTSKITSKPQVLYTVLNMNHSVSWLSKNIKNFVIWLSLIPDWEKWVSFSKNKFYFLSICPNSCSASLRWRWNAGRKTRWTKNFSCSLDFCLHKFIQPFWYHSLSAI